MIETDVVRTANLEKSSRGCVEFEMRLLDYDIINEYLCCEVLTFRCMSEFRIHLYHGCECMNTAEILNDM